MNNHEVSSQEVGGEISYQRLEDLFFQEVKEADPNFERAREVCVFLDESVEDVIKKELKAENWWLDSYWQEKGLPKEQIEVSFGDRKINIYNFNQEGLGQIHLEELKRAIELFSKINNGSVFDKIKYIVLDDKQFIEQTGENRNGQGVMDNNGTIKLYPSALQGKHRVEPASNFEGTLIHEITHSLQNADVRNEWSEKFGWESFESEGKSLLKVKNPERCITDYARNINPSEDICESMVATVVSPQRLDPERLEFLRDKFFSKSRNSELTIDIQRHGEGDIRLPTIDPDVKFKKNTI